MTKKHERLPRFDSIKRTRRPLTKYDIIVPLWSALNKRVCRHIEQRTNGWRQSTDQPTNQPGKNDWIAIPWFVCGGEIYLCRCMRKGGIAWKGRRKRRRKKRRKKGQERRNTLSVTQQERQTLLDDVGTRQLLSTLLLPLLLLLLLLLRGRVLLTTWFCSFIDAGNSSTRFDRRCSRFRERHGLYPDRELYIEGMEEGGRFFWKVWKLYWIRAKVFWLCFSENFMVEFFLL